MRMVIAFWLLCASTLVAQDATKERDAPKRDAPWLRMCKDGAKSHTFRLGNARSAALKRLDHPVLIHRQSQRDDQVGAVFLWVSADTRPAVLCDAVVAPDNDRPGTHYFQQEFLALCEKKLTARLGPGKRRWQTTKSAMNWRRIPDIEAAPKSKSLMLIRSRGHLKDYEAYGIDWRRGNQRRNYRLLPKPLYEYELTTTDEDGAGVEIRGVVFAFCLAVDPEIILSIEARTKAGKTEWFQAFGPFSDMWLHLEHKGELVWKTDQSQWDETHTATMQVNLNLPKE